MRKDFEAAVVTLREIEPAAASDVREYDLDRLQTALKGDEQLLWVQAVTWKTDPDAPENAIDTWERGVLAVTSDRVVFSGYDASMEWVLDDLAGVQYAPGGRGIFGAPAAVLIRERRGDRFLFMPQQKHKNASSRLVSILEEQIRKGGRPKAAASPRSPAQPATGGSVADEIAKLADLRDRGILDDSEFAAAKARLVS